MGLALGVVEKERGYSMASLGIILLLSPKKGLAKCSLLSETLSMLLGLSKQRVMLENSQGMQMAGPNPAPLHQQMDTASVSVYIQDLAGLVGDVKSPDTLPYFSTPGFRAELASLQGQLPT